MAHGDGPWFETVRDFTGRLVRRRAISPTRDERAVADLILELLTAGETAPAYTAVGLDPLAHDPYERANVFAFVRGRRPETLVLLGHFDTVDTADYGALEPWATDPAGLAERVEQLAAMTPGLRADLDAHPGDWLLGRGSVDMKSGVALNVAVIRRLAEAAARGEPPGVSVVFLATPDEETESAGVLQAVRFLLRLRDERGLAYLGAVNTDTSTSEYPGDPHRYVYAGTCGKLLPSFFVVGREAHVGMVFDGLDANLLAAELIRDLSMNDAFCDRAGGQVTPPPVTLRAADLKARYDVQIPYAAYFYLNVLTYTTGPGDLLGRLRHRVEAALARALERVDECEARWLADAGKSRQAPPRGGAVLTYAELRARAEARAGAAPVARALDEEWECVPAGADSRERCLQLVRRLWEVSGERGPAVVLYYSPPYYPHVAATDGPLHDAIAAVAAAHPELDLVRRDFYPYISDMSYLRLDPGADTSALTANMPVWRDPTPGVAPRAGAYTLPLDQIRALGLPVVDLGPYGRGVHQRGERVLMSYSFDILPRLLWEVIARLGEPAEPTGPA
jgi:arginine utilization protein RocB